MDDLVKCDSLDAKQWVPSAREETQDYHKWDAVYKKNQGSGKNLVMQTPAEVCPRMYEMCDPKGPFIESIFIGKIAADFYLPTFMGGIAGKDE